MARNNSPTTSMKDLVRALEKEKDQFRRKMLFIAHFFDILERQGIVAYLVGGEAVEIYTGGEFATGDIDITTTSQEKTEELLRKMSYKKEGMIWLNEKLRIAIQIVASYPTRTEKIRTVKVNGYNIKVEGVEDLIIDRLLAAKFWRSNPKLDVEQAAALLAGFKESIDNRYLEQRAEEEKVNDFLDAVRQEIVRKRI